MATRVLGTITKEMVGLAYVTFDGQPIDNCVISGVAGRVRSIDVGKLVFDVDGNIHAESDEQRDARLSKGRKA